MSLVPVREAARGRWRGILPAMGVDSRHLTGKNVPCPMCGGRDRFRFDDKEGRGTWICSQCKAGDGVALAMAVSGLDFRDTAERIESIVGTVPARRIEPERPEVDKRAAMRSLWNAGQAITPSDPAGLWLRHRVGLVTAPHDLRFVDRLRYGGEMRPAMLAMVRAPDSTGSTVQRTFLTADGRKAAVEKPRMGMPGRMVSGHAVRLFEPAVELGISEGIETALAAASLFGVPCWSGLNADGLSKWVPPEIARSVVIYGDNDASFTGQEAAFVLARRLAGKGIAVRVEIPDRFGADWNDVWREVQPQRVFQEAAT